MSGSGHCTSIINLRYQDGGEGSLSNPAKFNNQDYTQLKDNCRRRGRLFVDHTFPPNNQSLGDLPDLNSWREEQVKWLRPSDILKQQNNNNEPTFCMKGASRFDFGQGNVGNCWFLAAISSLTLNKGLMVQVVPMDQSFKGYAGIFHFRFWRFGKWVDVVIDDYLPTLDNKLLSVHSKAGNEFWVPLLEKAYAKVCGSYADMNAGLPSEACKDFTGGVHMSYKLKESHSAGHDKELWDVLSRATGCKSMICCGTAQKEGNTVSYTGLVDGHAYTVTAVTEVSYYGATVKLVRLLNPWGRQEWNGKWSDKSRMWERVSPEDREKCFNLNDGEFWMELEDFCYYFVMLFICCENPNFLDGDLKCQWKCMIYDGKWEAGRSAGGSINEPTFGKNPQYRIQVTEIDETEQEDKNILLSLMQKPQQRYRNKTRFNPIGLNIFKIPPGTPRGRLRRSFFSRNRPVNERIVYTFERDMIEQYSLQPGEYVVIPSTVEPNINAEFVLTVFSKSETKISPHDGDDEDHDHDEEENSILPEISTNEDDDKTIDKDPNHAIFNRYANQSGELSAFQLRKLLNDNFPHGTSNGFGLDTCKSMISMVDTVQRMTMTFSEFSTLWKKINEYKNLFHRFDFNHSGSLSNYEVTKAIQGAGMSTSDGMVMLMMFRYSGMSSTSLEDFITLMLRLDKVTNIFNDKSTDGVIHLSWEEWSNISLYN